MQEHVLCDPLKRGEKRKAQDIPQTASTSKTNRQDSESDADNDSFEELLVEGSEEKESDADDLLEESAQCSVRMTNVANRYTKSLRKSQTTAWGLNFTTKKSRKFPRSTADQKTVTPKVNSEIWAHLNRKVRTQDVRLQKSQALVCKAIVSTSTT